MPDRELSFMESCREAGYTTSQMRDCVATGRVAARMDEKGRWRISAADVARLPRRSTRPLAQRDLAQAGQPG